MLVNFDFISGVMVGFEFIYDEEDDLNWLFVDLFIIRMMIGWK